MQKTRIANKNAKKRLTIMLSIMLILCAVMSFVLADYVTLKADAYTKVFPSDNTNGIISISELLSPNRADTATTVGDKSIFNDNTLTALFNALSGKSANATLADVKTEMAKNKYNDGKFGDKTYTPNTSTDDYSNAFVGSIHYGMNSEDIRTLTGGKNIEVTFGGHVWSVVALTTTGTPSDVSAGDIVLTLMLKDPISDYTTHWNDYQTSEMGNHNEKYSSTFYSASKIRSILLNGKDVNGNDVKYTTDGSTLTSLSSGIPNYATDWAIFTDATVKKNVTNFLVKPNEVLYMQDENLYDVECVADHSIIWGTGQNEASLNKISSRFGGTVDKWCGGWNAFYQQEKSVYGIAVSGSNQTYSTGDQLYFDWGNDLLWLPSWAEVGEHGTNLSTAEADSSITGLWALNTNQRIYSNENTTAERTWLRSSSYGHANFAYTLTSDGIRISAGVAAELFAVRPALNLNLSSAALSTISKLAEPKDFEVTYNGKLRTLADFASESWYNADVYDNASKMTISIPSNAIHQGTYTVTFTLIDSEIKWADGTKSKSITLTIKPKEVGLVWSTDSDTGIHSVIANADDLCDEDKGAGKAAVIATRYRGRNGTTWDSLSTLDNPKKPNKIGSYTASAEIQNSDYTIKSGEETSKNFELESIKVPILQAVHFQPSNSQEYNGGNRNFVINGYENYYRLEGATDDVPVEIVVPDKFKSVVTFVNKTTIQVIGGNADTYSLILKLTDPENTEWADRVGQSNNTEDRVVEFSITQKELNGSIISGAVNVVLGNKATISLEMEDGNYPYGEDEISIDFKAYLNGSGSGYLVASDVRLVNLEHDYNIEIDTSGLFIAGNYILKFEVDGNKVGTANANYKVTIPDLSMSVTEGGGDSFNVVWRLRDETGAQIALKRTPVGTLNAQFDNANLTYTNGKSYTVTATYPTATYELDTNAEGGFVAGYKDNSGSNAGEYTTQIKLRNKTTNTTEIYTITWSIAKAKFELGGVNWKGNGKVEYTGSSIDMVLENLPEGLSPNYGGVLRGNAVGIQGGIRVDSFTLTGDYVGNYEEPIQGNNNSYTGTFTWEIDWEITQAVIAVGLNSNWKIQEYTDAKGNKYNIYVLADTRADGVVEYDYYEADNRNNIIGETPLKLEEIEYSSTQAKYYKAYPKLIDTVNYKFTDGVSESAKYSPFFTVGGGSNEITVGIASDTLEYNSLPRNVKLEILSGSGATLRDFTMTYYKGDVANEANKLSGAPIDQGNYLVVVKSNKESVVLSGDTQFRFKIVAAVIEKDWNKNTKPYVLKLEYGQINGVEYEIRDKNTGEIVEYSQLQAGNSYEIRAKIKDRNNYSFESDDEEHKYVTEWEEFELREEDIPNMTDPNDPLNPNYPQVDPNAPETQDPDDNNPSGEVPTDPSDNGGVDFDKITKIIKEWWQVIASCISIILIIIFISKGISNISKTKKAKKATENRYKAYYAGATGLFGLAMNTWTVIACVLMGVAVLSLVFMIITQIKRNKAQEEMDEARYDFERHKETSRREYDDNRREEDERRREEDYRRMNENMQQMFMRMMGGNFDNMNMGQGMPQGVYAGMQQGIGVDDIRGLISETVTALLPSMQQALPAQASANDELIKKLLEKEEKNDRLVEQLIAENAKNQETVKELMKQLAEKPAEKVIEKEVVATNVNDELINKLIEQNDKLMQKLAEQSTQQVVVPQPQIIEKVVEKPVEKIVEVPVEKVVEKVVEKPVVQVISREAAGGAEKSKQVKTAPKKAPTPRLTLAEAYAQLTKEQKKFFDGLREYAMKKDSKCKEKLATYFTTIGPSTTNPLIKLTIKKGITVALFKMEDEYLKDIRRNASSDGAKVKIKETEISIPDAQSFETAKDMVDLRVDQIERYNDFLKEQRSLRK